MRTGAGASCHRVRMADDERGAANTTPKPMRGKIIRREERILPEF